MSKRAEAEIKWCWKYLEQLKLGFSWIERPQTPDNLPAMARDSDYLSLWQAIISSNACSIILSDLSLLQFRLNAESGQWVGFAFYQCPRMVPDYKVFLQNYSRDRRYEARSDFVEYADTFPLREFPMHVRYDLDAAAFCAGRHPVAHIHFGHNTPLRVACERYWKPLTMVSFVVRQFYTDEWLNLLSRGAKHPLCAAVRSALIPLPDEYIKKGWSDLETRLA